MRTEAGETVAASARPQVDASTRNTPSLCPGLRADQADLGCANCVASSMMLGTRRAQLIQRPKDSYSHL
jgi:hypothetical protein